MAVHQALRNGSWQPDPLILDDQALVVHLRGRGLVVLTGCGHAGIVNTVRYARVLTGVEHVHAVLGGFYLTGKAFEPIIGPTIGPTIDRLAALAPEAVLPAHCTGWQATHQLANQLPNAFIPNSIGTRLELAVALSCASKVKVCGLSSSRREPCRVSEVAVAVVGCGDAVSAPG